MKLRLFEMKRIFPILLVICAPRLSLCENIEWIFISKTHEGTAYLSIIEGVDTIQLMKDREITRGDFLHNSTKLLGLGVRKSLNQQIPRSFYLPAISTNSWIEGFIDLEDSINQEFKTSLYLVPDLPLDLVEKPGSVLPFDCRQLSFQDGEVEFRAEDLVIRALGLSKSPEDLDVKSKVRLLQTKFQGAEIFLTPSGSMFSIRGDETLRIRNYVRKYLSGGFNLIIIEGEGLAK